MKATKKKQPRKLKVWVVCTKRGKPSDYPGRLVVCGRKDVAKFFMAESEFIRRGVLTVEG